MDHAANQLNNYCKISEKNVATVTNNSGCPIEDITTIETVGPRGPALLQDSTFLESMARFDRERIPERVVHAKGSAAFGEFIVTHDISKYTKAEIFQGIGKMTPLAVRFSTVGGEAGSADTARDPRGFAIKFYTGEGNWDLVGNNTPIFFIRDPSLFPNFIHTQKRNPVTHLKDANMFWDFISLRPETCHQVAFLFSDRGIPDGYAHMNGYGSHTFKMVNKAGNAVYCKFHFKTDQGIKNLLSADADKLAANSSLTPPGEDPDYSQRKLYNDIASGNFPSWTLYIQVMTFNQAEKSRDNPFDVTKVWKQKDYPLIPVGKMVLNRNPDNYFAQVEQLAFCPSHMVPGIEPSPDKMLQGRLFSYADTQRYRLGTNYLHIPVNCPYRTQVSNYQRDGASCIIENSKGAPNYFPNSFSGPALSSEVKHTYNVSGDVGKHNSRDEDNFTQAGIFWSKVLDVGGKLRLVDNMASHLKDANKEIQERVVANYANCNKDWGLKLKAALSTKSKL